MKVFGKLLKKVHGDERGAVSIETILIIAAIALPILIFILKFGWPRIREFFEKGMEDLEGAAEGVESGTDTSN
jgi:Flp pilus assembly pilin Flp